MTPLIIVVTAFVCLFFGAATLGLAIFFWYLLKSIRQMNATVAAFSVVLDPLVKSGSLQQSATAIVELAVFGKKLIPAMSNLNTTVALFNKAFFKPEALDETGEGGEGYAKPSESAVFHHTDELAAKREVNEQLKKAGLEVDSERSPVASQEMHGSGV